MTDEWTLDIACTDLDTHPSAQLAVAGFDANGDLYLRPGRDRRTGPSTWVGGHAPVSDYRQVADRLACTRCSRHPKPSWEQLAAVVRELQDAGVTRCDISHLERARLF